MSNYKKYRKRGPTEEKGDLVVTRHNTSRDQLTKGQRGAEREFVNWYYTKKKKTKPILRIGGGAGAGKSFFIDYLIESYGFTKANCYVMAYTGQAVNRLRQDGILATTIHSTIMVPQDVPVIDKETGTVVTRHGIPLTRVEFKPVKRIPNNVELIIIDEASFLPEDLEKTLLRYNTPILEVGDPVQLGPVGGKQVFRMDNLDYFIEGVMRVHRDSELFDFATKLRLGKNVNLAEYHDEVLFLYQQPTVEETFYRFLPFFKRADVVITSTNKQRQTINQLYRSEILGTDSPYPIEGERVICRRNNRAMMLDQYMLTNGTQGISRNDVGRSMVDKKAGIFYMDFEPDVVAGTGRYYDNLICDIEYLLAPAGSHNDLVSYRRPGEKFEYAHAITTHLFQGSQAEYCIFMDGWSPDPEYLARLRYTAATRATKRLVYMIPYSRYTGWCDLEHLEERNNG